jgi:tRNA-uridine 2-sulfurtransferase
MRVMVAMSGGVDSSVAAALLAEQGHEVVGATLKLWGGYSDSGCCSVADVDDARWVAQQLDITHHVFNLTEEFNQFVVEPYVAAHAEGRTPNPCIECNRHIKFARLLERADRLGFDFLATGHHAQVSQAEATGLFQLRRGTDVDKDQSYVLSMLGQSELRRLVLPVGEMTKADVRRHAERLGLGTASKPDSQDVCFINQIDGREGFLAERLDFHDAEVVDQRSGQRVGTVDAVEMVTVGQRRGMGHGDDGARRYVVAVDIPTRRVTVGGAADVLTKEIALDQTSMTWVGQALGDGSTAVAQVSAHGRPFLCTLEAGPNALVARFNEAQRLVASGQTVALYDPTDPDSVVGAGIAA